MKNTRDIVKDRKVFVVNRGIICNLTHSFSLMCALVICMRHNSIVPVFQSTSDNILPPIQTYCGSMLLYIPGMQVGQIHGKC